VILPGPAEPAAGRHASHVSVAPGRQRVDCCGTARGRVRDFGAEFRSPRSCFRPGAEQLLEVEDVAEE
jgi:ribosomal protein S14